MFARTLFEVFTQVLINGIFGLFCLLNPMVATFMADFVNSHYLPSHVDNFRREFLFKKPELILFFESLLKRRALCLLRW
jgi:hypothetical protein